MVQPASKRLVTEATLPAHVAEQITTPGTETATALNATILEQTAAGINNPETDVANAVNGLIDGKLAGFTPGDAPKFVFHGTNANYARPAWDGPVIWNGSVAPANRIAGDFYYVVSTEPVPWTPLEIPALHTWYDPTQAVLSGANIVSVPDRSGNGHDLTVVTGTPTYSATGLNGMPGMVFNGTSKLQTAAFTSLGTGPVTVFFAGYHTAGSSIASFYDGAADGQLSATRTVSTGFRIDRGSGFVSTAADNANPHVFCMVYNEASSKIYVDGVLAGTGSTLGVNGNGEVTKWTIGGRPVATNRNLNGAEGDWFVMQGEPTAEVRAAATAWLAERTGITVA